MSLSVAKGREGLAADQRKRLFRRHLQGAYVRSGASVIMWSVCLTAFLAGVIGRNHLAGVSGSCLFLILMNPPTLWALRRMRSAAVYKYFSLFINVLEVVGYTAILYFLGGIEAMYANVIYVMLITYVGTTGPPTLPFVVATLCVLAYGSIILLDLFGVLPHQGVDPGFRIAPASRLGILGATVAFLYVAAFMSYYSATVLRRHRHGLQRRNRELLAATRKAEESDRLKSEFLANMSHELRTPLNAVIGFSEILLDGHFGQLNPTQAEYVRDILSSGRHLKALINDVLELSSAEAGSGQLVVSEAAVGPLLRSTLSLFTEHKGEQGVRVTLETAPMEQTVWLDERKFRQILYNLLSNAAKFSPDKGAVQVTAKMVDAAWLRGNVPAPFKEELLSALASPNGHYLMVSVADSGIGIAREHLENIFKAFYQVDGSSSRRYGGVGMGLALCKEFLAMHKGGIWVESHVGKGSVFSFVLPADRNPKIQI